MMRWVEGRILYRKPTALCSLCASTVCFSYLKKHKIHMKTTTPWINGYGLKWPALCGILWASGTLQFCYAIPISSHDITTILGSVPITILLCFLTYIVSIYIELPYWIHCYPSCYSNHDWIHGIIMMAIPCDFDQVSSSQNPGWLMIVWDYTIPYIYIYIPRESKTFNF